MKTYIITVDDIPTLVSPVRDLDKLQKMFGGVRGYGGPNQNGHWLRLRCTKAKMQEIRAAIALTQPT